MEASLLQLQQQILQAAAERAPLLIRGSGSKDFYGEPFEADNLPVLDTRIHNGITAYDPDELVITAKAGTPLADIQTALAARRQMLPFEPPHFGRGATFGGMIASGLAGPRRMYTGAVKDFVLGCQMFDGQGRLLRFGGRVVKNVAGYDVHKLMAGALGTLGVLTEISLKVLPQPFAETTLQFEYGADEAVRRLNRLQGEPLPLSASFWADGALFIRLSGTEAGVAAAQRQLGGEPLTGKPAHDLWLAVREQLLPLFQIREGQRLWRISLPDTAPAPDLPGDCYIEWGGALRWYVNDLSAEAVRRAARQSSGQAVLFAGEVRPGETVFPPPPTALAAVQGRLKQQFDPHGIFNPHRLHYSRP